MSDGPGDDNQFGGWLKNVEPLEAVPESDSAGDDLQPGGWLKYMEPLDPVPESEQSLWYYRVGALSFGPVTREQLAALAHEGRFDRETLVYAGYAGKWVRADSVYGLFEGEAPACITPVAERAGEPPGESVVVEPADAGTKIIADMIDWAVITGFLTGAMIAVLIFVEMVNPAVAGAPVGSLFLRHPVVRRRRVVLQPHGVRPPPGHVRQTRDGHHGGRARRPPHRIRPGDTSLRGVAPLPPHPLLRLRHARRDGARADAP